MKFAVANEHREYFQQNKVIEFEGLLTSEQLNQLNVGIDAALSKRLAEPLHKIHTLSADKLFLAGRDLWRDNNAVKKLVTNSLLGQIAAELMQEDPIRLGYDQYLPVPSAMSHLHKSGDKYQVLLGKTSSLEEVSCLQGVRCGLILCLKDAKEKPPLPQAEGEQPPQIFPMIAGNGSYFTPEYNIPFKALLEHPGQSFLLITYTQQTTVYVMREGDPNVHELKKRGYVFGDKLTDKLNPIVHR
jgi:hypothetical protein